MRFYRLLLRLYPFSFRADYEDELAAVHAERAKDASGPFGSLWLALGAIFDVVPNAIASHWEVLRQDLHFAVRSLRRAPGFTITALLVAALGVGANTAAFSLTDFVLVRPLPFMNADRLLKLWESNPGGTNDVSPANFRDWQAQSRSFTGMGAFTMRAANLVGAGEPRRLDTVKATPELLPLLGVPALIGRPFTAEDTVKGHPVVLSHSLWQSQFGGDAGILGRGLQLDGVPHTVVGVMPATFQFPRRETEAWTPLVLRAEDLEDRNDNYLQVLGRLRDGVTFEKAREELAVIAARLEKQYPRENEKVGVGVLRLRDEIGGRARLLLLALCGAAICILLLSCANLASLFLARGTHRARELAVRSALGAGRERLVRQLVTESFAIAFVGGAAGIALAAACLPLLARLVPSTLPIAEYPGLDWRVLALAAGFVLLTGLAFGVLPAVRASNGTDMDALRAGARSGGGRTQRLRSILVLVEIVASVVLLVSAGLLIRAVWNIQSTAPGFRADNVLAVRTALPLPKYDAVATRQKFFSEVLTEVRALPGVQSAAFVTGLPMDMRGGIFSVFLPGQEERRDNAKSASLRFVTPQFFTTMKIPLHRGRDIAESDAQKQPFVAVISESLAKDYWPSEDPIGKRINVAGAERTVVGIVGDVRVRGLERASEPQVYLSYQQVDDGAIISYIPKELVVQAATAPNGLVEPIRRIVREADPEQPISNVRTMDAIVTDETASRVTQLRLLGALAAIALLIAAIGIHGLLTYSVSRRLPELGVRRTLGADLREIVTLVVREGIELAGIGIVIGVIVAYIAARGMGALLVGVRPSDPLTFATAAVLCFLTVLAGCLRPAVRAAQVNPTTALRAE